MPRVIQAYARFCVLYAAIFFTWLLVRSIARMYRKRSNKHHIRLIESVYTFHVGQINRNQQIKDGNTRRVRSIDARARSQFIENAKHLR